MNAERRKIIEDRLRAALAVVDLEIEDQSHLHAGHAGAAAGGGHFHVRVVSPDFSGEGGVSRHRRVYAAIGDALRADTIHALGIEALTPAEAGSKE